MKLLNTFLLKVAAILLIGIFAPFSNVQAQDAAKIKTLLGLMEENRKTLTSMRANVRMEQYNPQLDETDVKQGKMIYLPNKNLRKPNVRIDWDKPQEQLSVLDGKFKMFIPSPGKPVVYVGSAESRTNKVGGAFDFINMNTAQMRQNFKAEWLGTEQTKDGVSAYKLKLTPKNTSVSYSYAEIWVDEKGMPVQAKVVEKNGDHTIVSLSGIEKNVKITKQDFQLKIPKGVPEVKV